MMFSNDDGHSMVEGRSGAVLEKGFDFLCFSDVEEAVKADVEWLKVNKAVVEGTDVSGWIYEVESGRVRQVV